MTYPELKIHLDLLSSKEEKIKFLQNYEPKFMTSNNMFFIVCDDGDCHLFDINGNEYDISKMHAIGYDAFSGCTSLTSISIPDSVKSIGYDAFFDCMSLASISIPNSVESIGHGVFAFCESLTNISIPDSVESIGYNAFYSCNNLKEIVFKGKTIDEVKAMKNYPWGIKDKSIIKCKI